MKRTQIQLPDTLYKKLKRFSEIEETTVTDIIRKASEYFLSLYPNREKLESTWELPRPQDLGVFMTDDSGWRLRAHEIEQE
jgi:hypothetical protein